MRRLQSSVHLERPSTAPRTAGNPPIPGTPVGGDLARAVVEVLAAHQRRFGVSVALRVSSCSSALAFALCAARSWSRKGILNFNTMKTWSSILHTRGKTAYR